MGRYDGRAGVSAGPWPWPDVLSFEDDPLLSFHVITTRTPPVFANGSESSSEHALRRPSSVWMSESVSVSVSSYTAVLRVRRLVFAFVKRAWGGVGGGVGRAFVSTARGLPLSLCSPLALRTPDSFLRRALCCCCWCWCWCAALFCPPGTLDTPAMTESKKDVAEALLYSPGVLPALTPAAPPPGPYGTGDGDGVGYAPAPRPKAWKTGLYGLYICAAPGAGAPYAKGPNAGAAKAVGQNEVLGYAFGENAPAGYAVDAVAGIGGWPFPWSPWCAW